MSPSLQPQVTFPIVRQIGNHTDSTTYYVRAVVRDAEGNTIDTVNLAAQGSQRYQTGWRTPADPTGRGIYISIVTSVYTDSGYTTKSENYSDEENTYLVYDRVLPAMRGGGGGVDAYTIRRIFSEEFAKVKTEEPEEPEDSKDEKDGVTLEDVMAVVGYIADEVKKLPREVTDISPVLKAIKDKPVTQVDLGGITSGISELKDSFVALQQEKKLEYGEVQDFLNGIHTSVSELTKDTLESEFSKLELVTTQTVMHVKDAGDREKFDITKYAT